MEFFIGKPYDFRDYNCYHHVAAVREYHGIATKMFQPKTKSKAFELITAQMKSAGSGFSLVDSPEDFDMVMVEKKIGSRVVYHCGVYHDGNVSHCDNAFGSVRYESYSEFIKSYERATFWR